MTLQICGLTSWCPHVHNDQGLRTNIPRLEPYEVCRTLSVQLVLKIGECWTGYGTITTPHAGPTNKYSFKQIQFVQDISILLAPGLGCWQISMQERVLLSAMACINQEGYLQCSRRR